MLLRLYVLLIAAASLGACQIAGQARPSTGDAGDALMIVRGSRIFANGDVSSPPILRLSTEPGGAPAGTITLEFDVVSNRPPNAQLLLVHCDRDWNPTRNIFVNDNIRLQTSELQVERSPINADQYDYTVSITFPSVADRLEIIHSGNYLARVVDYFDQETVLLEERFFVVESGAAVDVAVFSEFFESGQTDVVQNGLRVRVTAEPTIDLMSSQVQAIHLYESGKWYRPMPASGDIARLPAERGGVVTRFQSGFGGLAIAEFSNLPSGNEHRWLDLTDLGLFPTTGGMVSTPLSDLPRGAPAPEDNNGLLRSRFVSTLDDDYVYFEFRLDLEGRRVRQDIAVVGTFNRWTPDRTWRMHYDSASGFYVARGWIKRAFHEYEYVAGTWDVDRETMLNAEATLLEGNTNYSSRVFYAFVYYRDIRSGGYDRIIGVGGGVS